MTDLEARVIVTQTVTEGLLSKFPDANPQRMHEAAVLLVQAVIDEYFKCRLMVRDERKPS